MSEILKAYKLEHAAPPKSPQQLVHFSKQRDDLKTVTLAQARQIMGLKRRNSSVNVASLSKKANPRWTVGTQVLLSKDRMGIIRYVGPVPEQGQGHEVIWYGVELTDGTVGYNDGMVKGSRYFQTDGKRGMFVPPDKIRRVINQKDKQRRDSYAQLANEVSKLKGQCNMDVIQGNDALVINCNKQQQQQQQEKSQVQSPEPNGHSIYIQHPSTIAQNKLKHQIDQNSDGGNISPLSTDDNLRPWEKDEFAIGGPSHKLNMKAKKKAAKDKSHNNNSNNSKDNRKTQQQQQQQQKSPIDRSSMIAPATQHFMDVNSEESGHSHSHSHSHSLSQKAQRGRAYSIESDRKEYGMDLETIDSYDTLLEYVLRQSHESLSILLDVYANPELNPILKDAFNQMKEMDKAKQAMLWPQLIKRWRRYLRTKK